MTTKYTKNVKVNLHNALYKLHVNKTNDAHIDDDRACRMVTVGGGVILLPMVAENTQNGNVA